MNVWPELGDYGASYDAVDALERRAAVRLELDDGTAIVIAGWAASSDIEAALVGIRPGP
jgi:hypothetical protein